MKTDKKGEEPCTRGSFPVCVLMVSKAVISVCVCLHVAYFLIISD